MQTITKEIDYVIDTIECFNESPESCLFFDIETTGFAARYTNVYLIGCIYYKDSTWVTTQWFADSVEDEATIISLFYNMVSKFKLLIHFNGEGFDIPYLKQKAAKYNIEDVFQNIISIDLFKFVASMKKLFKLENYKQKSIELFLGINREDKFNGGQLIDIYSDYIKNHSKEALDLLLLHNYEDIIGMTRLLPVLSYSSIKSFRFTLDSIERNDKELILSCKLLHPIPKRVSASYDAFYLTAYSDILKLRIKIYPGELKYFYSNYKDYYYLPAEDVAMHKSVAFYVDKNFRTKAKAANCYSKKTGAFIPQFSEILPTYFKIDYHDKTMYIELTDDFLSDNNILYSYICDAIQHII